ncbi:hypothetical protein AB3S75_014193 [Citrus x aurantiifolia]
MLAEERSVDMYKLSAYFSSRNINDLPLDLILPIIVLVIICVMVGLRPSYIAFSQNMLTVFLCILAAQGLGLIIGVAFMDVKKAKILASIVLMTSMLSGGLFIQKGPFFMSWLRNISFNNYDSYQHHCSSDSCSPPFIRELRIDHSGLEVWAMMPMIIGYRLVAYLSLRRMKIMTVA